MIQRPRPAILAFFALLLIVDSFLYFRHAGHFFQGDTIFLLHHRAVSVGDFFRQFTELSPSGWYRPLASEVVESMLYPIAGLHPVPYRIPVYVAFIAISVLLYVLFVVVSGRHLTSAIAVFFFTIQTANAYTTYDAGFMPELLFSAFYFAAMLAFLQHMQNHSRKAYAMSLGFFVLGLLSKESAITLPATLFAAHFAFNATSSPLRRRFVQAVRATAPHFGILLIYLLFAIGYLHVMGQSIRTVVDGSQVPQPGDYIAVIDRGILKTADMAFTWAFNIPRGYSAPLQNLSAASIGYLKFFRALALLLMVMVVALCRSERKLILFGFAWFWIAVFPALTLIGHFLPYYLFLPVAGISLAIGVVFAWFYDQLHRFQPPIAATALVSLFGAALYVNGAMITTEIKRDGVLGGSADAARNTLEDLKRFYPAFPDGATLYFADANDSLSWPHDSGSLIRMAYGTNGLSTRYQSLGDSIVPGLENAFVFRITRGRLMDETATYQSDPTQFMNFANSELKLELSANEVITGRDAYMLRIKSLADTRVDIAYSIDHGPLKTFSANLDSQGTAMFDVTGSTKKGLYQFYAFKAENKAEWVRTDAELNVR